MQKLIISLILAYIAGLLLGHGFWYFPYSTGTNVIHGIITAGIFVRLDKLFLRRVQTTILPCLIGSAAYIYSAVQSQRTIIPVIFSLIKPCIRSSAPSPLRWTAIPTVPDSSLTSAKLMAITFQEYTREQT